VVKLVVNSPTPNALHCKKNLAELFASIQIALTLELIWRFHNQVVFQAKPDCPLLLIKNLELKIVEHVQASLGESYSEFDTLWRPPNAGVIKINVDAAMYSDFATIVAVARNESGLVVKAWAKKIYSYDACIAEALAIRWAIELAKVENWCEIIVESDAQVCMNALLLDAVGCEWRIYNLRSDILDLASKFDFCEFCWVKREANMAAHSLAS
jgi:ribonuclease HI